ncbi:23S rRNA (adenine(2030)-N(6))-methyltransferase RlmJ [Prosthecodimorpha staleyi]|uniref:Ribosomal RNA large subunit methyltransferase J n=1 Tax=Prosthecodimorpha staleyi TaxID=2840188 RepID=A0A947D1F3_9HYPH|nr:23S rRNA (adenine(2030)-N(6))-methyltransferase RlmJ [Prosthecodimorpha staleyi]MBT9289183.1 23S rRNA (adenine(2030)-N(6))-methyltransferase RlmJ [Prosthecodimorpha staleyi]
MNYRHVYHAGNFADVLKHAVLARIIVHLQKKETPFRLLDTHAGTGLYDLSGPEAQKTGEWRNGIGRILRAPLDPDSAALLAPWLAAIAAANGIEQVVPGAAFEPARLTVYPGSPMIARHMLRKVDRLTLTELHPADFTRLSTLFAGDVQVKTIELDGWLALKSFLPPKERRGAILVDPPFEQPDEFRRLADGLVDGLRRFAGGVFALWYPIKDEAETGAFHRILIETGIRKILRVELRTAQVEPGRSLTGSGLILVNPPWTLEAELGRLVPALAEWLATGRGAGGRVDWLVAE